VQVWTGFIYEGPSIVNKICQGLVENGFNKVPGMKVDSAIRGGN
jgi:dihydroorotate dehydrogenase